MPAETRQTIPVLRIFDVEKAKEFYTGFLGFEIDWEHRFEPNAPLYMQVSRGRCVLHLTARGYRYMRPGIETAPWNAKLMEVIDPFGNRIRFNEDLGSEPGASPWRSGDSGARASVPAASSRRRRSAIGTQTRSK